jgi:tetratricopeptide (TPR) repeat protein
VKNDFMMTAEEIRLRNLKRRRLFFAAIALVLMLTAGFFGGRPTLNAIKSWQVRRHATNAFAAIQKEDWIRARNEAIAAYQLRSTEPQAIRAVARFLSRTRQADALDFWQQLEKNAALTREDRQDEAAIAIAVGESSRAEIAVNALLESQGADPACWLLAAQLAIQKGATDDAMSALQKIFSDARTTEQQQLQGALLELTLASGNAQPDERASDAWSRIEKLSTGTSAVALDSLVLLARRALSGAPASASSSDLSSKLVNHPLAKAPQKLLAVDVRAAQPGANRDQLIGEAIAQWKDTDADDQLALATWLNSKNEFQKTLDAIPLEKALVSRELLLQDLDALGGLGRWKEIKQLLDSERYPLDPVVQRMYLARCNAQLGEKTAAENNWQRALEAAGGDAGKLVSLGEYAEKNGIIDVARQAFDAAVTESPKLRVAHQGRLRIAQRSGDTKKIHAVLADMLKTWPNDAAVQNDEAYTRLLLTNREQTQVGSRKEKVENDKGQSGSELDQIVEVAANLVVKNPRSMPHRTLLALAYLRENRTADAVVVYKDITVTQNALTPSALAVHAAVLAADGQTEAAKSEARQINTDQLLREERDLIQNLRRD